MHNATHNTQPEHHVGPQQPAVSNSGATARPWVKPALERLPLKDALSGPGKRNTNDLRTYGS